MLALLFWSACNDASFGDAVSVGSEGVDAETADCVTEDGPTGRAWAAGRLPRPVPLRDGGWLPLVEDGDAASAVLDFRWGVGEPFAQFEVEVLRQGEVLGRGEAALAGQAAGDACLYRYGEVVVRFDVVPRRGEGALELEVHSRGQDWEGDAAWTLFVAE